MIQLLRNWKTILISLLLIILFTSCSQNNIKIKWIDLSNNNSYLKLIFVNNNQIKQKLLKVNKTKMIYINPNFTLNGCEHNSSFNIFIKKNDTNNSYEIYVYPNENYKETEEYYIVNKNNKTEFYFMECYDQKKNKNYYIISKDEYISKNCNIAEQNDLRDVLNSIEEDIIFYNDDNQKIDEKYIGYIIPNENDDDLIILSTLWARYGYFKQ